MNVILDVIERTRRLGSNASQSTRWSLTLLAAAVFCTCMLALAARYGYLLRMAGEEIPSWRDAPPEFQAGYEAGFSDGEYHGFQAGFAQAMHEVGRGP